jgi:hypothetical protein
MRISQGSINHSVLLELGYYCLPIVTAYRHRLKVFADRVLRRIFEPMSDELMGGWIRLCNDEFHSLYSSPNVIMVIT